MNPIDLSCRANVTLYKKKSFFIFIDRNLLIWHLNPGRESKSMSVSFFKMMTWRNHSCSQFWLQRSKLSLSIRLLSLARLIAETVFYEAYHSRYKVLYSFSFSLFNVWLLRKLRKQKENGNETSKQILKSLLQFSLTAIYLARKFEIGVSFLLLYFLSGQTEFGVYI